MNKYYIELMKYTEEGVPTNEFTHDVADTPQGLADKVSKYNKMRYTKTDEEGKTIIGNKMYKVTPKQGVYTDIVDWDSFVNTNGIIYR